MNFKIEGLSPEPFRHLYGLTDDALKANGAKRYLCDEVNCYPDRIEMRDTEIGETLLLVNHTSMAKESPYKATHAIFVREGAQQPYKAENTVPPVMYNRVISLRAFDKDGMMLDAKIAQGEEIRASIEELFVNDQIEHIDAHNAVRGCFSGRITRS